MQVPASHVGGTSAADRRPHSASGQRRPDSQKSLSALRLHSPRSWSRPMEGSPHPALGGPTPGTGSVCRAAVRPYAALPHLPGALGLRSIARRLLDDDGGDERSNVKTVHGTCLSDPLPEAAGGAGSGSQAGCSAPTRPSRRTASGPGGTSGRRPAGRTGPAAPGHHPRPRTFPPSR